LRCATFDSTVPVGAVKAPRSMTTGRAPTSFSQCLFGEGRVHSMHLEQNKLENTMRTKGESACQPGPLLVMIGGNLHKLDICQVRAIQYRRATPTRARQTPRCHSLLHPRSSTRRSVRDTLRFLHKSSQISPRSADLSDIRKRQIISNLKQNPPLPPLQRLASPLLSDAGRPDRTCGPRISP